MIKEKRILSYFIGWLIIGFCILFIGVNNVFAETYTPTEIKSQIRTIYTDGTTQWYTSANNNYTTPLYFGTGPSYSSYGIPCNFRLLVVNNIDTQYSYKYSYDMHIFTPYSTSNTWDSSKIDSQYDLKVLDDSGIVKESKCSVTSTEKNNNAEGTFMNKSISCVFTVNKNYTNAYISAGYFCKGDCTLSNMEKLGYIPQDSRMSIDNVKIERFNDNSNIIIDQNQTIIDQNNTTNEKLDDLQQSIINSNKENTDKEIESQKVCKDYNYGDDVKTELGYLSRTGTIIDGGVSFKHTDYIKIEKDETYTLTTNFTNNNLNYCLYKSDKTLLICQPYTSQSFTITPTENGFIRYSTRLNYSVTFSGKYCENGNQALNDKLDNLQGALTDSSSPDTSGLANSAGWLPVGPLDSVLNLPLSLFNALTTNLNKSCSPIIIPLPYVNKNITLPCINTLYQQIGITTFLSWIGVIVSGLMLYTYLLKLYKWIEDRISLNETHNVDSWGGL